MLPPFRGHDLLFQNEPKLISINHSLNIKLDTALVWPLLYYAS